MMAEYDVIDGIKTYAPSLAFENGDYPAESFEKLYALEDRNFWFRSRNRILQRLFRKHLSRSAPMRVLEVGCGTGYVLKGLSRFRTFELVGADIYIQGLRYARQRLPHVEFVQLDMRHTPFQAAFDAIGAFDVLEHIDEDELVMRNIFASLKPGGMFFVTVPQHKRMWSVVDESAKHKRRYSRSEMTTKLRAAGFHIVYATSFVFALAPAMLLSRLAQGKRFKAATPDAPGTEEVTPELDLNPLVNAVFGSLMRVDELLIRLGVSLPFGGSLLVVARRE